MDYFGMASIETSRFESLEWLVDRFFALNFEKISYFERSGFIEQLLKYLYGVQLIALSKEEAETYQKFIGPPAKGGKFKPTEGPFDMQIGEFWASDIISADDLVSSFWKDIVGVQSSLRTLFYDMIIPLAEGKKTFTGPVWKVEADYFLVNAGERIEQRLRFKTPVVLSDSWVPLFFTPEEHAKHNFLTMIKGLPIKSFRRCRECNKIFLQFKGKPKTFCSTRCQNRWHARQRREADPEGYRAKQREVMRKKYREKKAKELGKSVDKVIIQERVKKK